MLGLGKIKNYHVEGRNKDDMPIIFYSYIGRRNGVKSYAFRLFDANPFLYTVHFMEGFDKSPIKTLKRSEWRGRRISLLS